MFGKGLTKELKRVRCNVRVPNIPNTRKGKKFLNRVVMSDHKCRGQLGQISGKYTLGYYDTLAFSLRKSESATWCMLATTRFRRQEGSTVDSESV